MQEIPFRGRASAVRLLCFSALTPLLLGAVGCSLSPLNKHALAFNQATKVVIVGSENSYSAANRLHHEVMVAKAVSDYDKNTQWNPYTDVKPLLTPEQLDARIKVLDGLKAYAATLVDLTTPKKNKELDSAAAGIGSNVKSMSGTLSTSFGTVSMDDTAGKALSTAVEALGQFLIDHTTQKSLKDATQQMNPNVKALCDLLDKDVTVLRRQADVDFQALITDNDQLIRHNTADAFTHREQVGRLIDLAARSKANDKLLEKLQTALHSLAAAHQALTDTAQGNNAETLKQRIVELSAAGESLATFYESLPSSASESSSGGES